MVAVIDKTGVRVHAVLDGQDLGVCVDEADARRRILQAMADRGLVPASDLERDRLLGAAT